MIDFNLNLRCTSEPKCLSDVGASVFMLNPGPSLQNNTIISNKPGRFGGRGEWKALKPSDTLSLIPLKIPLSAVGFLFFFGGGVLRHLALHHQILLHYIYPHSVMSSTQKV